jgi:iron only hydrogenase large subunit-like protein
MGALVKNYFAREISIEPSELYHVTIMPCLDKRNESSRRKFYDETSKSKEVDLVLTTEELIEIITEKKIDFMALERGEIKPLFNNYDQITQKFFGSLGGPSDGFLEFIFKQTAQRLYNVEIEKVEYYKRDNNENFRDVLLSVNGEVVLRFGAVYGFRNIQQITKLIKQSTCDYDFLEVMACPSGCTNGGGQLKLRNGESRTEIIAKVNQIHNNIVEKFNDQVPIILNKWFPEDEQEERKNQERIKQLHTSYQPGLEKKENTNSNLKKGCKCTAADVQW